MKIKKITIKENDDGVDNPSKITVSMTIKEAAWIACLAGRSTGISPHNSIYECLSGDLFNRFWEDGVDGAVKEFGIRIQEHSDD